MKNNFLLTLFVIILLRIYLNIIKNNKERFQGISQGPNIIQTWKNNDIPDKYKSFTYRVKKMNPKSKYMFFTDQDIDYFIKNKFPEYYNVYQKFPYKIQKIDFFRYLAVYYYGGVYLDLDIYLYKSLHHIGKNNKPVFPLEYTKNGDKILREQGFQGLIGNYAFYAPKKCIFLKKIIDNIVNNRTEKNIKGLNNQKYVFYTTGPVMVTQSYIDFNNKQNVDIIKPKIFKSGSFGDYGKHHLMGSWK